MDGFAATSLSPGVLPDDEAGEPRSFLDRLFDGGLLIRTGVDGLYGRSGAFESVVEAVDRLATGLGAEDGAEALRFPPAMARTAFERSGYLKGFPNLAGTVHCFCGNEADHANLLACLEAGDDWTGKQAASEVVLTPAACYPLYPVAAARGRLPADGLLFDLQSYCFRHEPSLEPTRMQLFRMREYVRMGSPEQVLAFREMWLERGTAMMAGLGLPLAVDPANDPFFGRAGRMLANNQRNQGLKFELNVPVNSVEKPTACLSFNYHQDHFGLTWGLEQADGSVAHTACVGFGLERITLALLRHHGLDLAKWPAAVREKLWG
ncbi:amino acid--[acyl-carrier-protein] ligase [Methylobacterium brachythecii]|uniref:Amino acid--[acyl-carrier-protein] ligase n=1 Tax=Methylobacterium brachythecii TaxID=1176177 RepID=A0A7W6ADY0_9HYPH|nr:amino acid--[acyl-carrier-protein] ligase [Methylobacterium brachythecii]MBB3901525.1 seryl-tRNA synthetase [Methylobacterium brachythecii]GLS43095.1 amino acid--[acyl-carrier-protein] ligase [Methylobacterium brachythecii]